MRERSRQWFGVGILFGLAVVLYGLTSAVGLSGMADSDELLGVVWQLGVAHPPGYPLFVLVSHGVMRGLSFLVEPVRAGQLTQVLWQSLALSGWFGVGYGWVRLIQPVGEAVEHWWLSLLGAGWLLVSLWFWQYGLFLEVFGWQLLWLMVWFGWLLWVERRQGVLGGRQWMLGGLWLSLLLGHHQLSLLLLPGFLWLVWRWWQRQWVVLREVVVMGAGMVVGLVGQLGLLGWLGLRDTSLSWQFSQSIEGVWRMVSRADFSGFILGNGEVGAYLSQVSLQAVVVGFLDYWGRVLLDNFTYLGVGLIVVGLYGLWQRKGERLVGLVGLWWLFTGPLLSMYLSAPQLLGGVAVVEQAALTERMWLINLLLSGFLLLFGLVLVWQWLALVASRRRWLFGEYLGVVSFIVVMVGWHHLPQVRMDTYHALDQWTDEILLKAPDNAVITCFSDVSCFALRTGALFYGEREDITLVPVTEQLLAVDGAGAVVDERYLYPDNPFRMGAVMAESVQRERVVLVFQPDQFYRDWLGFERGIWDMEKVPGGLQVGCDGTVADWKRTEVDYATQVREWGGTAFFKRHALMFASTTDWPVSLENECKIPAYWWQQAAHCSEADFSCQYQRVYWGMLMAPFEAETHLRLASVLEQAGHIELALREYRIALVLDEDSPVAREAVARLDGVEELEFWVED